MKKISSKKRPISTGCWAEYIRTSKYRGVKLFHYGFNSEPAAKCSNVWNEAIKEANTYIQANKRTSIVPKCYGAKVFYYKGSYRVGISLKHLGYTTLQKHTNSDYDKSYKIEDRLLAILRDNGIDYADMHNQNVMYYKGKYYVIDMGNARIVKKNSLTKE